MQSTLLSRRVYDEIYEAMLASRLGPGDRLNRRQVAADLGVSVAPVLEAMTQLEWEGFLETSPRRGTIVKKITARHSLGRFRLRQAIEVEAARSYAGEPVRHASQKLLPSLPARAADIHSRLVEGLAKATPDKAEQLVRQHLAPWITALEQAAADESPHQHESVRYVRGQSVSLKAED